MTDELPKVRAGWAGSGLGFEMVVRAFETKGTAPVDPPPD